MDENKEVRRAERTWSVVRRLTLLNMVLVTLTAGMVGVALHLNAVEESQSLLASSLEHVAATGVMLIDVDAHAAIRTADDTQSPQFQALQRQLQALTEANDLPHNAIYTLRKVPGEEATVFVAMAGTPYTGDRYALRPELKRALTSGEVTSTARIYEDRYGAWLSAYAPLRTDDGVIDGVLEVDYRADRVQAFAANNRVQTGLYTLLFLLVALVLSVWTVRRMLSPLGELTQGIAALAGGYYGHRVQVEGAALELRVIAESFNDMAQAIETRGRALESSERRYRALFNASREAFFVLDAVSGEVIDYNPASVALLEVEPEVICGAHWSTLFALAEVSGGVQVGDFIREANEQGAATISNVSLPMSSGQRRLVDMKASWIELEQGPALQVACWDVTRQRQQWAQLMQTSKLAALGEMAGGLAHEINNPLVGVLNFAQLLVGSMPNDDPQRQLAEGIEQGARRCRDIVRALLNFGRRDGVSFGPVQPERVIEEAVRLSRHQVELGGGQIDVEVSPQGLAPLHGNAVQLVQVLLNLIGNSSQAGQGVCVVLRASLEGDEVVFEVEDDGAGVDPALQSRIFEPFFTTKAEGEGTGLGLSVAYNMVQSHKGRLRLMHSEPGKTVFEVRLPHSGAEQPMPVLPVGPQ